MSLELNINYFIYTIKGGVVRPEGSISDSINVISVLNDKHFDKLIKYVKSEFSQTTFVQNNESSNLRVHEKIIILKQKHAVPCDRIWILFQYVLSNFRPI